MMILRQCYLVPVLRIHKMSNMRVTRMRSSCSPSFFLTMFLNCSIYLVSYTFHNQFFFTLAKNRFPDHFTSALIGENLPAGCPCLQIVPVPPLDNHIYKSRKHLIERLHSYSYGQLCLLGKTKGSDC